MPVALPEVTAEETRGAAPLRLAEEVVSDLERATQLQSTTESHDVVAIDGVNGKTAYIQYKTKETREPDRYEDYELVEFSDEGSAHVWRIALDYFEAIQSQKTFQEATLWAELFVKMLIDTAGDRAAEIIRKAQHEVDETAFADTLAAFGTVPLVGDSGAAIIEMLREYATGGNARLRDAAQDALDLATFAGEAS